MGFLVSTVLQYMSVLGGEYTLVEEALKVLVSLSREKSSRVLLVGLQEWKELAHVHVQAAAHPEWGSLASVAPDHHGALLQVLLTSSEGEGGSVGGPCVGASTR